MRKLPAQIVIQQTPSAAAQKAVEKIIAVIGESRRRHNACFVALSGGTSPRETYRSLTGPPYAEQVPWDALHVFFGDERDVAQDNVDSNYRMAADLLLDHVPIPMANVHPMPADSSTAAASAQQYEDLIRKLVPLGKSGLPEFDLIMLGIGGDGHTASLFPDTEALRERQRLVVDQFVPVIGRNRMTFTYPLLNAARHVLFLVTGADKANALSDLFSDDEAVYSRIPAAAVMPTEGELTFILDTAAASQLTQTQQVH